MFIALYILSLAAAAGLTGSYAHLLLAEQGFIADMQGALLATGAVAAAFACVQLGIMALLNLVAPSRGGAPLLAESISNGAAILLAPALLRLPIPWPHPKLDEYGIFVLGVAFVAVHIALKLFSLFAALQSRPCTRLVALVWVGACLAAGSVSLQTTRDFVAQLNQARVAEQREAAPRSVDSVRAIARGLSEGARFQVPLDGRSGKPMLLHVAFPEDAREAQDKVHFTVEINGASNRPYIQTVTLPSTGWGTLLIPAQQFPADATTCDLLWGKEPEPAWMMRTGVRPVQRGGAELLVAGPYFSEQRTAQSPKSIVALIADGIAMSHTSLAGYERDTTPGLAELAAHSVRFESCMTPSPETPAALMSIMTGLSPLRHGFLNGQTNALPPDTPMLAEMLRARGYLCAAFTEGESTAGPRTAAPDLVYGTGIERGFHLFDQAYPMSPATTVEGKTLPGAFVPTGSGDTLERARGFITEHREVPFFVVIRLRELSTPRVRAGNASAFGENGATAAPMDVYDSALKQLDDSIAQFVTWLDDTIAVDHVALAIASPFGFDFPRTNRSQAGVYLSEGSLHVPMLLRAPGANPRDYRSLCSLEDLAPTLASIAGTQFDTAISGMNLLGSVASRDAISMTGDPLALSLRTPHWRFTWQSGRDAFTKEVVAEESFIEFFSLSNYRQGRSEANAWERERELAGRYRQRLLDYMRGQELLAAPAEAN